VKALISGSVFQVVSSEPFVREEKFSLDLTGMPVEPNDPFLNQEVKEIIYEHFLSNLNRPNEAGAGAGAGAGNEGDFQLELPVFGISVSSQNISDNAFSADSREAVSGDDGFGTLSTTAAATVTTSHRFADSGVMMTFPVFGFNITAESEATGNRQNDGNNFEGDCPNTNYI
jgi:hypothetical protein